MDINISEASTKFYLLVNEAKKELGWWWHELLIWWYTSSNMTLFAAINHLHFRLDTEKIVFQWTDIELWPLPSAHLHTSCWYSWTQASSIKNRARANLCKIRGQIKPPHHILRWEFGRSDPVRRSYQVVSVAVVTTAQRRPQKQF